MEKDHRTQNNWKMWKRKALEEQVLLQYLLSNPSNILTIRFLSLFYSRFLSIFRVSDYLAAIIFHLG